MGFYKTVNTKTLDTENFEGVIFEDLTCENCKVINYDTRITINLKHNKVEELKKRRYYLIFTDKKTVEVDRYNFNMNWECNVCCRLNSVFERIDKHSFEVLKDKLEEVEE